MRAIQFIHAHIRQSFPLLADVAVGGRIVGELLDPVEIMVALGVLLHADVWSTRLKRARPTFVELASPASSRNVLRQGLVVLVVIIVIIVVTIMVALVAPFLAMMRIGDGLGCLQRAS